MARDAAGKSQQIGDAGEPRPRKAPLGPRRRKNPNGALRNRAGIVTRDSGIVTGHFSLGLKSVTIDQNARS